MEFNRKAITTVELRTAKGEMEKLTSILNENEMEGLLRAIQEVTIEAGQTIITKGEKGTHMYIIKSGTYTTCSSSSTAHCTAHASHQHPSTAHCTARASLTRASSLSPSLYHLY